MKVGSYTSYLGYPVDGSKAREIKVSYNIHENKCNGKKKLHQFMCDFDTTYCQYKMYELKSVTVEVCNGWSTVQVNLNFSR